MRARLDLPIVFAAVVTAAASPARADDIADRAAKLHRDAIVVDTHLDAPDQLAARWADVATKGATDHFDLPRAHAGGLTAPFFSIYVSASYARSGGATRRALELIDITRRVVDENPTKMMMATTVADIRAAKKAGKLAVLMGIEGGHAIEDSLAVLREMYRLGVRYMTLTHTNTNNWADSSGMIWTPDFDARKFAVHGGLSEFGRAVVGEMNRLGMIVDISHVSDATLDDVLEVSKAPVMASHSSCRAIADMPRNLTDDQIKRVVAKGGVIMINFGSVFVDQKIWDRFQANLKKIRPQFMRLKKLYMTKDPARFWKEYQALFARLGKRDRAGWTVVVDHIEHAIKVAGPDSVGLGTDYDGVPDTPIGLDDVSMLPKITEELLRRGHSETVVKKVLGENFLAFMTRVDAARRALSRQPPSRAVYTAPLPRSRSKPR